eukprot:553549-Amphidinium_carterae.2
MGGIDSDLSLCLVDVNLRVVICQRCEEIDALVYVDHGIQPADPRPELPEIELAFQEVDLAWSDASQDCECFSDST